ncbi:hypothetical protein J6O48_11285 [bacterium]|nr:hypothetical protein [bacterium]
MIYFDPKYLTLYYILKETYKQHIKDIKLTECFLIIVTDNENLYEDIENNVQYFKDNNFYIPKEDFQFSKNIFSIIHKTSNTILIYGNHLELYNKYKLNITLFSENGFIIENPDIDILEQLFEDIKQYYDFCLIGNTYIFLLKNNIN